ncbi:hypothetical protein TNCV_4368081 [Trichonephila clavipes]|nr:hypothetical protein TNCV_4368081 [Trichonephila clavipes]
MERILPGNFKSWMVSSPESIEITGICIRRKLENRPCSTTAMEERCIVLTMKLPSHLQLDRGHVNFVLPRILRYGNRDYTGMWVRLGSTDLMVGKVMFLRSNQGDRLNGNESVVDSFRSDLVGFKSWSGRFLGVFSSLLCLPEKTSSREANSLPEVTPQSLLFSSDKYHPCNI